jgi:hypothetical protein
MSEKNQREIVERVARRIRERTNLTQEQAKKIVMKYKLRDEKNHNNQG